MCLTREMKAEIHRNMALETREGSREWLNSPPKGNSAAAG